MTLSVNPAAAWQQLPAEEWNADAARHLLRRAGWSARPDDVERAAREGLGATLDRLFPSDPPLLPKPRLVARFEEMAPQLQRDLQKMSGDDRLRGQRELQERGRVAIQELTVKWLQYAAEPEHSVLAKWVLFLSDVYVVSAEKARSAAVVYEHFDILARLGLGSAPALSKAVSRSPAMVIYLDLAQSNRKAPNENFARELFELFVLGEGNYTEADIKEAARAFTGYRVNPADGKFRYVPAQFDSTPKTVFGATGNFTGDDVIDLAYKQSAAATFLPRELVKFYLSDVPLPAEQLSALGETWRAGDFNLRALARQFFGSRLFFAPEFRGNFIKSPIQFYLGLIQDAHLDVAPLPRLTINPLRQMGQALFYPPNVRGWVGGRNWINSSTLTARRQLVELLFTPLDENALNADEQLEVAAARSNGAANFTAADDAFARYALDDAGEAAARLTAELLPGRPAASVVDNVRTFIAEGILEERSRLRRVRRAAATLMQSPDYQLC
jgi:uncharacterized protein (DUF1800 family)